MVTRESEMDPNSFANNHEIAVKHLHLKLNTDFEKKIIEGSVDLDCRAIKDQVDRLILDSSYIDIKSIKCADQELEYKVEERHHVYGSKIIISLASALGKDEIVKVTVEYSTTDKCTAVQWLNPEQTVGKKAPYLFTQCQAIHARSLVPCQDTPSVKITYSAEISVPRSLRALMSAIQVGENLDEKSIVYFFDQKIAIPSYLIALAVGNLKGIRVGPRSTVWSEPEVVEAAAWEFQDTEEFIKVGESLLTPYVWGVYDLLLLPGSFPYGGMENPCLTFVTPTLLAGDRSLVDVVAHEISHSWMGNLVTTQNWEHFWLNEGFTVFVERKIAGRLHGREMLEFDSIIGLKALKESVHHFEEIKRPEFSVLCPCLKNQDPDDAFSSVPYEKGFNLLYYLETILGGAEIFEPYLKAHVEMFSHKSITTNDFKDFLFKYFSSGTNADKIKILESVDWESWFHKPGMPIIQNNFDDSLAKICIELANDWDLSRDSKSYPTNNTDFLNLSANQKIMFLEKMMEKPAFPIHVLEAMNSLYRPSEISNAEIKFRWQMLSLNSNYEKVYPDVVNFVSQIGRMKFVRPLYRSLFKVQPSLAKEAFEKNRSFYHPICSAMVAKDLGVSAKA